MISFTTTTKLFFIEASKRVIVDIEIIQIIEMLRIIVNDKNDSYNLINSE